MPKAWRVSLTSPSALWNYHLGLRIVPLLVLALIWLWFLIVILHFGIDTSTFKALFGWDFMVPHGILDI